MNYDVKTLLSLQQAHIQKCGQVGDIIHYPVNHSRKCGD